MTSRSQGVNTTFFGVYAGMPNGGKKKNIPARLDLDLYEQMREAVFHRRTTFQSAIEEGLSLWLGRTEPMSPGPLADDTDGVMSGLAPDQCDLVSRYAEALRTGEEPDFLEIIKIALNRIALSSQMQRRQRTG